MHLLPAQAAALYRSIPPSSLQRIAGMDLSQSVAAAAYKVKGRWEVPEVPPPSAGMRAQRQRKRCSVGGPIDIYLASAPSVLGQLLPALPPMPLLAR